jgi:arabinofuranosyltransferase
MILHVASSLERALLGIALVYAAFIVVAFPKGTVDDAYITYRYAENLALHGQLTWNAGEDPVEGYTGVALPLLLAGAVRLGLPVDATSKVIGVAAFFLSGLVFAQFLARLGVRPALRAVVLLLYCAAPFMPTHALSGLETMLFGALVISSLYALLRCLEFSDGQAANESALFALLLGASLVRPEGVALAALSVLALGATMVRIERRDLSSFAARMVLILVLPGLAYFAWRYTYYGQLLPNTYYAKWHHRLSWETIESLAKFFALYVAIPVLPGIALAALRRGGIFHAIKSGRAGTSGRLLVPIAVGLAFVALCCVQYVRSHLVMNYSYRFFAPFLPILLACAALLLELGLKAVDRDQIPTFSRRRALLLWVLGGALVIQLALFSWMLPKEITFASDTMRLLQDEHIPAGRYLRENVPSTGWLIVVVDAGAIPYYSRLKTVDFGGLNDEFLSKRFRNKIPASQIMDYFFSHNASAVVFTSRRPDTVEGPETLPITQDQRFQQYVLAKSYGSSTWESYYELVFLRRDLYEALPRRKAE